MKTDVSPVALIAPYEGMAEMAKEICKEFEKPITIELVRIINQKGNLSWIWGLIIRMTIIKGRGPPWEQWRAKL
jgi:hypothetical protein